MRASGYLTFLAILLILLVTGLSGFASVNITGWEGWIWRGVIALLCIAILFTGRAMRLFHPQEKKSFEEELSVSEARFRAIFNDAAVGIGIMGLDRKIIDANPALCRMYGRTCEEMIGMNASEATYPSDNAVSDLLFLELISGQHESYETDRRYVRKNGEVFWAHVTMSSVRGPDGKPRYLVGMVIDVNQEKQTLERLRESEARFQATFENAAVGIALMTLDRKPISFNPVTERIIGYNAEEMQSIDPRSLVVPEDKEMDTTLFEELINGQRNSYVMERRYRHKDGHIFWARINYSLVRDRKGKPDYLIGIIEDIDEQKRSAERLAEQEAEHRRKLEKRVRERTYKLADANL
ncbi:MAG TPA: PAS domain S-box protein, partial [Anaerolineales bacterium]|nr:PAS domain S-box protein [Anaerolineales bacterium]